MNKSNYSFWDRDEVNFLIKNNWFGPLPLFLESVESSNTYARELYRNGASHGTVVITESQTQGRGRMSRTWFSPPGLGIWMSILIIPPFTNSLPAVLNFIATLSVVETIKKITSCTGEIKWPNDVLVGGKKICGVLSEKCSHIQKRTMVVVGIGINVNQTLLDFPYELRDTATSFKILGGRNFSREVILAMVLENIKIYYTNVQKEGVGVVYHEWLKNCSTLGRNVCINVDSQSFYGIAEQIDETGKLYIRTPDNQQIQIIAGDLEYDVSISSGCKI